MNMDQECDYFDKAKPQKRGGTGCLLTFSDVYIHEIREAAKSSVGDVKVGTVEKKMERNTRK